MEQKILCDIWQIVYEYWDYFYLTFDIVYIAPNDIHFSLPLLQYFGNFKGLFW